METSLQIEKVLATIQVNRAKHEAELEIANKGFLAELKEHLIKQLELIAVGKIDQLELDLYSIPIVQPESHLESYDSAIEKLQLMAESPGQKVTLSDRDFDSLMKNKWDWTKNWSSSNFKYFEK